MWLFEYYKDDFHLEYFPERSVPQYAILSHRWREPSEVLFEDIPRLSDPPAAINFGVRKIQALGKLTLEQNLAAFWIDTCCIDRKSSAELDESIRSMYRWYKDAAICFAYLDDVEVEPWMPDWATERGITDYERTSRLKTMFQTSHGGGTYSEWFERAWTLQELIAPGDVIFFDRNWRAFGRRNYMATALQEITGIDSSVLNKKDTVKNFSVAQRMSWAAGRTATRMEDETYSLLGLFDVSMSTLYGEGGNAFMRLQKEIISESADQSIFAWSRDHGDVKNNVLATSARKFKDSGDIVPLPYLSESFRLTNLGLEIDLPLFRLQCSCSKPCRHPHGHAIRLYCRSLRHPAVVIALHVRRLEVRSRQIWALENLIESGMDPLLQIPRSRIPKEYEVTPIILKYQSTIYHPEEDRARVFSIQIDCDTVEIVSTDPTHGWSRPEASSFESQGFDFGSEKPPRLACLEVANSVKHWFADASISFKYQDWLQIVVYISTLGVHMDVSSESLQLYPRHERLMTSADSDLEVRAEGVHVLLSPQREDVLGFTETIHHLSVKERKVLSGPMSRGYFRSSSDH